MKKSTTKWLLVLCTAITLFSCKEAVKDDEVVVEEETKTAYTPITNEDLENAVIYEANIRQYSEAGTFNEFTKDIPQLKELGVKVIWLMPVFPISEKNRKAKGDLLVEDIKNPKEREKYLGSYYAVADYEKSHDRTVICDFVCPTHKTRNFFEPDITIWVDTISQGRFEDTNKIFETPSNVDIHITRHLSDEEIEQLGEKLNHGFKEKIII
mgnify:CR=1 FL=1